MGENHMTKPQGQLVTVKDRNMHIRKMGTGSRTIVLLPGHNLPLPSVEFAPLMRDLSQKHTVCAVELFGYGHSSPIDTVRTNENTVQEIREGLAQAGLKPPYVLMPYSASGIYAEYYAAKYPEEIEALILLDASPSVEAVAREWDYSSKDIFDAVKELEEYVPPTKKEIAEAVEFALEGYLEHGYTEEELIEIYSTQNDKRTILAQDLSAADNMREVMGMRIPDEIPILVFYSDMTQFDEQSQRTWERRVKEHMYRLGERVKTVTIEGSTHGDIICKPDSREVIWREVGMFLDGVAR